MYKKCGNPHPIAKCFPQIQPRPFLRAEWEQVCNIVFQLIKRLRNDHLIKPVQNISHFRQQQIQKINKNWKKAEGLITVELFTYLSLKGFTCSKHLRNYIFLTYKEQTHQRITTTVCWSSISLPAAHPGVLSVFSSLGMTQIMIASGKLNHTSAIWELQSFIIRGLCLFRKEKKNHIYKKLISGIRNHCF